jgi:ligand-binding sensor domain-containing protein
MLSAALAAGEPRYLDRAEGLPSDDVLDLAPGRPGRVWAATTAGLCRIEAHTIRLAGPEGVPRRLAEGPKGSSSVYALYPDGLALVTDRSVVWVDLPLDPATAGALRIQTETQGDLILVAPDGAWRLRGERWEKAEGSWPDEPASLEHRGEIWTPTRGRGILRERVRPRFQGYELPGLVSINALAATPEGDIWCGTERGLARVSAGSVETITSIGGEDLGVVTACAVDRAGRVWVGSGSSFTGVYRRTDERWEHLDGIDGFVHRITIDPTGAVWFAVLYPGGETGRGAWYFSDERFRLAPAIASIPSARVYDVVARDPSGVLWFATLDGLAAYDGKGRMRQFDPKTSDLRGEKVWCLSAARDGSLWLGYQNERGVSRLARGEFRHYDVEDGLCDGNVWSIVEGRPGVLWFATRNGLSRFDGRRWSCFRNEEGLKDVPIWPLLPREDGSLWIGTLGGGLVHLSPDDELAPRSVFEEKSYSGRGVVDVHWTGSDAWFDTPHHEIWYRWRVDGRGWSEASPATSAQVTLPPGRHDFQVQAIDRFGNAEDPPASVEVLVTDPAGLSWIAICAVALMLLMAGFTIGRRAFGAGRE